MISNLIIKAPYLSKFIQQEHKKVVNQFQNIIHYNFYYKLFFMHIHCI